MTHTPTLPNGFSRDFSEAPDDEILAYVKMGRRNELPFIGLYGGGEFETLEGDKFTANELLCWCPIPTPGDAVLKELAEEGR